jgi:site-specific recombinase XerD
MNASLIPVVSPLHEKLIALVCRTVRSDNSKKAYRNALNHFFAWLTDPEENEHQRIDREAVLRYREHLEHAGLSTSTISLRLSVIRQLCKEARLSKAIDQETWEGIAAIPGPHREGRRTGNWLTATQAAELIETPPADTLRGKRDRAILATLIGCGIRRAELCSLKREQIQQRDGRWVIVDIAGKGQRVRTVPMPSWTKAFIDEWWTALESVVKYASQDTRPAFYAHYGPFPDPAPQYAFRSIGKGNNETSLSIPILPSERISRNAIFELVTFWSQKAGFKVAPHDLRRTFSKLALRGKADLHQIQLTLGHASIQTTERYLGTEQDLSNAPCDVLGIEVELPGSSKVTI